MDSDKFYIAPKCRIGQVERSDTYTGKLGFVVPFGPDGAVKKEKSLNGWRDHSIPTFDFENVPTDGFVINRSGGGWRGSDRQAFIRVWDPRDFEIEIGLPNLLWILKESNCSKGKGLEGKFLYGWEGQSLVLIPVDSPEYQESVAFTAIQGGSFKPADLTPGLTYWDRAMVAHVYLGKFDYYEAKKQRKFVFWSPNYRGDLTFDYRSNVNNLTAVADDAVHPEFSTLVERYLKGPYGSPIKRLFLKDASADDRILWARELEQGVFEQNSEVTSRVPEGYTVDSIIHVEKGMLVSRSTGRSRVKDLKAFWEKYESSWRLPWGFENARLRGDQWIEPTSQRLFAELESGSIFRVNGSTLYNSGD